MTQDTNFIARSPKLLRKALTVTPSDSVGFTPCVAVQADVAGFLNCLFADSEVPVIIKVLAGVRYDFCLDAIYSTSTTATGITVFYA